MVFYRNGIMILKLLIEVYLNTLKSIQLRNYEMKTRVHKGVHKDEQGFINKQDNSDYLENLQNLNFENSL